MAFPELEVSVALATRPTETPTWIDITDKVFSATVHRGREDELSPMGMGTAEVVLDNIDRRFDPSYSGTLGNHVQNPSAENGLSWWATVDSGISVDATDYAFGSHCFLFTVPAITYYMATDGDDGSEGSIGSPWATFAHAATVLEAHNALYVRAGTYNERAAFTVPITLAGYPGETVIIDGTGIVLPANYTGLVDIRGVYGEPHISGATIRNLTVQNVEVGAGIYFYRMGICTRWVDNVLIDHCYTNHTQDSGIVVYDCIGGEIAYCTVRDAADRALGSEVMEGCLFSTRSSNMEIHHCEVYYQDIASQEGAYGIGILGEASVVSYNGRVHHNYVHDLWNDGGIYCGAWTGDMIGCYIYDNYIERCGGGLACNSEAGGLCKDFWYYNNIVKDHAFVGIHIASTAANGPRENIYIINNTIFHSVNFGGAGIQVKTSNITGDLVIRGNAVYMGPVGGHSNGQIRVHKDMFAILQADHNIVYGADGYQAWENRDDYWELNAQDETTYETWANPRFVDTDGEDFHLKDISPCIGAGVANAQVPLDYDGNARPHPVSGYSVGAYEHGYYVIPIPTGGQLFNIRHETRDFSEYTSTVNDGRLVISAPAALAGTAYGMAVTPNDTTAAVGRKTIAAPRTAHMRARLYFDPNTVNIGEWAWVDFFSINLVSAPWILARMTFRWRVGDINPGFEIYAYVYTDGGTTAGEVLGHYVTDEPHILEIEIHQATTVSASDGWFKLWVDGLEGTAVTDLDNYDI